jgi:hypothetical protein
MELELFNQFMKENYVREPDNDIILIIMDIGSHPYTEINQNF